MGTHGFKDDQAAYAVDDRRSLIGQIRRLGDAGPAYEVVAIEDGNRVLIEVIESGERVSFPIASVLEDPLAETIP
jgi:hypothetical protein